MSTCLGFDLSEEQVEEAMIEGTNKDIIDKFIGANGSKVIMFLYQQVAVNHFTAGAHPSAVAFNVPHEKTKVKTKQQLVVSAGYDLPLSGTVIVLTKTSITKELDYKTAADYVNTIVFDAKNGAPAAVNTLFQEMVIPTLDKTINTQWRPEAAKSVNGRAAKDLDPDAAANADKLKLRTLQKMSQFMKNMEINRSICSKKLKNNYFEFMDLDWSKMPESPDPEAMKNWIEKIGKKHTNNESERLSFGVKQLEMQVHKWADLIENALNEASRMRKEDVTMTGPQVELNEWRERFATFAHLIEQIRTDHRITIVRGGLMLQKSKVMNRFMDVDARLSDANNQSMDNVKFLYSLESFWTPLYSFDIDTIEKLLPDLLAKIKLVANVSAYYNTNENLTSLLLKITGQLVIACRNYMCDEMAPDQFWTQTNDQILVKIDKVKRLHEVYRMSYDGEDSTYREFKSLKISTEEVFNRLENFLKQLAQIEQVIVDMDTYSVLKTVKFDSSVKLYEQLQTMQNQVRKLSGADMLNQPYAPKGIFGDTLITWTEKLGRIHKGIREKLRENFEMTKDEHDLSASVEMKIATLLKFEKLNLHNPSIGLDRRYQELFDFMFKKSRDIMKTFENDKRKPPADNRHPTITSKIMWVRSLFGQLYSPLEKLKHFDTTNHPNLQAALIDEEHVQIIRHLNQDAQKLLTFEDILVDVFQETCVEAVKVNDLPLLIREIQVENQFHNTELKTTSSIGTPGHYVFRVQNIKLLLDIVREAKSLSGLNIRIGRHAEELLNRSDEIKHLFGDVELLVNRHREVRSEVPKFLDDLLLPHAAHVDRIFEKGLTVHTWKSLNAKNFIKTCHSALDDYKKLVDHGNDILFNQIDGVLKDIEKFKILDTKPVEPYTTTDFIEYARKQFETASIQLPDKSRRIESSLNELMEMLLDIPQKHIIQADRDYQSIISKNKSNSGSRPGTAHFTDDDDGFDDDEINGGENNYDDYENHNASTIHPSHEGLPESSEIDPERIKQLQRSRSVTAFSISENKHKKITWQFLQKTVDEKKMEYVKKFIQCLATMLKVNIAKMKKVFMGDPTASALKLGNTGNAIQFEFQDDMFDESTILSLFGQKPGGKTIEINYNLFRVDAVLNIPEVELSPNRGSYLETIGSVTQSMIALLGTIPKWEVLQRHSYDRQWAEAAAVAGESSAGNRRASQAGSHSQAGYSVSNDDDDRLSITSRVTAMTHVNALSSKWECLFDIDCMYAAEDTFFDDQFMDKKELLRLVKQTSSLAGTQYTQAQDAVKQLFKKYMYAWKNDENAGKVKDYLTDGIPKINKLTTAHKIVRISSKAEKNMARYVNSKNMIEDDTEHIPAGAILINTRPLKDALKIEINDKIRFIAGIACDAPKKRMYQISEFTDNNSKKMSNFILKQEEQGVDIESIENVVTTLNDIFEAQIDVEMEIDPIESFYLMLSSFDYQTNNEDSELVDSLRYQWNNLVSAAKGLKENLYLNQNQHLGMLNNQVGGLVDDIENFYGDWSVQGPTDDNQDAERLSDRLILFQSRFDQIWRTYESNQKGQNLFGIPVMEEERLHNTKRDLNLLQKLFKIYRNVMKKIEWFKEVDWSEIDAIQVIQDVQDFQDQSVRLPNVVKERRAFNELKNILNYLGELMPLVIMMKDKSMKARHWEQISETVGSSLNPNDETHIFRGKDVYNDEIDILANKEEIEDICTTAQKEHDISAKLDKVQEKWINQDFEMGTHKSKGDKLVLFKASKMTEIQEELEDSSLLLSSLSNNRYKKFFAKRILDWQRKVSLTSEICENLMTVQSLWNYLEAVFNGGDIGRALPEESRRFSQIDKSWEKITRKAVETPNVIDCCNQDDTYSKLLNHLLVQLETCQRSLDGYLEEKRNLFARFYFVSNPVLLEILGQSSNPNNIQEHLLNIFANVKKIHFHPRNANKVIRMESQEGEVVPFPEDKPVNIQGTVENWLQNLLNGVLSTVKTESYRAWVELNDSQFDFMSYALQAPGQIALLCMQILWTRDSEKAISMYRYDRNSMNAQMTVWNNLLSSMIERTTDPDIPKLQLKKMQTLITIFIHQKEIFEEIIKLRVRNTNDFDWQRYFRFYFDDDVEQAKASITDVSFYYQNEYIGVVDRLCVTPLTDRCYITLAQALNMSLGGAPAGPAGTGKTETTKDMASVLGKYVVVFNCSDQDSTQSLGRVFKGLAQSGAWGCFDEFNRILLEVLSVAAQHIAIVLGAKKERRDYFMFPDTSGAEGRQGEEKVSLNREFGLFITMNPGYAGRQDLPENLKINFRQISMMVPDKEIIIAVKLAASGFQNYNLLARKFFMLYTLSNQQLSVQVHYDWGLRNILSVLRTLAKNIRIKKISNDLASELKFVKNTLKNMNMSKLVDTDENIFSSLLDDLFPLGKWFEAFFIDLFINFTIDVSFIKQYIFISFNKKLIIRLHYKRVYKNQRSNEPVLNLTEQLF